MMFTSPHAAPMMFLWSY